METTGSIHDCCIKYTEYLESSPFPYTLEPKGKPDEIRDYLEGLYIRDHYPKVILTLDEDPETQYDRIRRINARDWMPGLAD